MHSGPDYNRSKGLMRKLKSKDEVRSPKGLKNKKHYRKCEASFEASAGRTGGNGPPISRKLAPNWDQNRR